MLESPAIFAVTTVPTSTTPWLSRRLADGRVAQQLGELADARLDLALLVFGGVVAAVLLEVALFAGGLDLLGDVGARGTAQLLELGAQPVVGLLGQPRGGGCVGHGDCS